MEYFYDDISIIHRYGGVIACVVNTSMVNVANWLEKNGYSDSDLLTELRRKYTRIAILRDMSIDNDQRGKGYESTLFEDALSEAESDSAEAVILLADINESNKFNLVEWYKSYGFEVMRAPIGKCPLLLLDFKKEEFNCAKYVMERL